MVLRSTPHWRLDLPLMQGTSCNFVWILKRILRRLNNHHLLLMWKSSSFSIENLQLLSPLMPWYMTSCQSSELLWNWCSWTEEQIEHILNRSREQIGCILIIWLHRSAQFIGQILIFIRDCIMAFLKANKIRGWLLMNLLSMLHGLGTGLIFRERWSKHFYSCTRGSGCRLWYRSWSNYEGRLISIFI